MKNIKILIVEDEVIVSMDIKKTVEKLGYYVSDVVHNYTDAIQSIKTTESNMILMDINLKNSKDGIQTVIDIQKIKKIPVIYLTAYSDNKTIQRAVETNPVGYLQKPFKREDLNSTIVLGLYKSNANTKVSIDKTLKDIGHNYYYCQKYENLYYKDQLVKISVKEKILLKILIQAEGKLVAFKELEYSIWDGPVSESSLRTLVYRLRHKLEHKVIETIPSFGVRLKS